MEFIGSPLFTRLLDDYMNDTEYAALQFEQVKKDEIWMLTVYAKNEAEDIPVNILRKIKKVVEK